MPVGYQLVIIGCVRYENIRFVDAAADRHLQQLICLFQQLLLPQYLYCVCLPYTRGRCSHSQQPESMCEMKREEGGVVHKGCVSPDSS